MSKENEEKNKELQNEEKNKELQKWDKKVDISEKMIPILGKLYRKNNVVTELFGRQLYNQSILEIIKQYNYCEKNKDLKVKMKETYKVLEEISKLDIGASRVDIGYLTLLWNKNKEENKEEGLVQYLKKELESVIGENKKNLLNNPQDIVLYGFGRIGRLLGKINQSLKKGKNI
jgi:glyceraldehyde 3-phosphate dehydrogenase